MQRFFLEKFADRRVAIAHRDPATFEKVTELRARVDCNARLWCALMARTMAPVIGSADAPTLFAQVWFRPHFEPLEEDA